MAVPVFLKTNKMAAKHKKLKTTPIKYKIAPLMLRCLKFELKIFKLKTGKTQGIKFKIIPPKNAKIKIYSPDIKSTLSILGMRLTL